MVNVILALSALATAASSVTASVVSRQYSGGPFSGSGEWSSLSTLRITAYIVRRTQELTSSEISQSEALAPAY